MRKLLLVTSALFEIFLINCTKSGTLDNDPQLPDSSKNYTTGYVPATFAELNALGFVEDLDSSTIPEQDFWVPQEYIIPNMPPIADQAPYNACTPFAVVHGMLSRLYRPTEAGFTAAPFYVWNKLNNGMDVGFSIPAIMKELKENGAPSTSIYTHQVLVPFRSTGAQTDDAARHTLAEYHPFKTIDRDRIKGFLFKNYPLPFGARIDDDFMYNSRNIPKTKGRIVWNIRGTGAITQHALLLIGYSDSLHAYRVQNSWKPNLFGEQGYIWIDYDFFEQVVVRTNGIPEIYWATPLGVTTNYVNNIKATTASVFGHVQVENGQAITQRGICWSDVSQKPRVSDQKVFSGNGIGNFSGDLTGLKPNTKYYVRAFATKALGLTIYGTVDSLITANVEVTQTGQPLPAVVNFTNNESKNFTLINLDGSIAPGLNYTLVSIGNSSNPAVVVSKANTGTNFSLKVSTAATGIVSTTFDVFYDSKLVQNIAVNANDSTEFYKNLVPGEWLNTWDYKFPGTTGYSFYEEDKIICYPDGHAKWVWVRYYTGNEHAMDTDLNWSITRQGSNYIFSLGAQSGRITPTNMSFLTQVSTEYQLTTHKN
ncbi:hypothetical protein [Ferruginibacter sp. HRS2-29]|uniref:hypothetical protein n=1 Tax=Ferruginibacter sp. HRS2-29 TaxID=2487334 RepID=UPI0020CD6F3C|nr:hypothetical protein [Ferruginibacter sp. HRS2-29]MCP9751248.1 hypothetical protein [Ferruginibacter sp. HRS2-29]